MGGGDRRESSAESYLAVATEVRDELSDGAKDVRLGIASQRSTFTVWEASNGRARLPLVSWQDRRARDWCARHRAAEPEIRRLTGLRLSSHYVGPKLAAILERDRSLHDGLSDGACRVGTLDSWVLARWSGGAVHETDHTMAARTLMASARQRRWLPSLTQLFGVPSRGLAAIEATTRECHLDDRFVLGASISDQSAAALAGLGGAEDGVLVNLGTGGFVLRPTGSVLPASDAYLAGPLVANAEGPRFALEGTINGAAGSVDRFAAAPTTALPVSDPAPEAFALPDEAGIGSPHWRGDLSLTLSPAAAGLDAAGQRATVAEGIVFRVREILDGLGSVPPVVRLSGGLSRDPFFAEALSACLDRPVEVLDDPEQTLRGIASLTAGRRGAVSTAGPVRVVAPSPERGWLRLKYPRWQRWLQGVLARADAGRECL